MFKKLQITHSFKRNVKVIAKNFMNTLFKFFLLWNVNFHNGESPFLFIIYLGYESFTSIYVSRWELPIQNKGRWKLHARMAVLFIVENVFKAVLKFGVLSYD